MTRKPRRTLHLYYDVWRQRRALHGLTNRQLADLGLTREAAEQEASRPFWDLRGIG
ncbi:DUF1127 domain-containing protein [Hoeflea sp.]|uniref:DUF1127 domain-containing protein n=1 Tax=Hoeflea sp. TaxID=1940281 RepID=UPI003B02C4BE